MTFTVRQLEIFVAAAQDCNFAHTAARLEISQPAVSEHIRALESRLGYPLFQRRRGTTPLLTPAGSALLNRAQALLQESVQLDCVASDLPPQHMTMLRVYAGSYLLDMRIRPNLQRFCMEHPDIQLDFVSGVPRHRVPGLVKRARLDLAVFATSTPSALPKDAEILHQVPCSIVGSPIFAGAAQDAQTISRLPFVLPVENSPEGTQIAKMLSAVSIVPQRVIARSQYLDVVKKLIEAGKGLAVLFDEYVSGSLASGRLVKIGPTLPSMSRVILRRQNTKDQSVLATERFFRSILSAAH